MFKSNTLFLNVLVHLSNDGEKCSSETILLMASAVCLCLSVWVDFLQGTVKEQECFEATFYKIQKQFKL